MPDKVFLQNREVYNYYGNYLLFLNTLLYF